MSPDTAQNIGGQLTGSVPDEEDLLAAGLYHRVAKPTGPGPYSTVVMIHGRSGDEKAMWIFARTLPVPWFVVAPRGIKTDPGGGYSWRLRQQDEWPPLDAFREAVTSIVSFIHNLTSLYNADPERIFLMGFSQGAATAYATAMLNPGLIQGIAGLVGFVPGECETTVEPGILAGLPIFMAAGQRDPLIPLSLAQEGAQTLKTLGADVSYREYDTGHRVNTQGMKDLKAWWSQIGR